MTFSKKQAPSVRNQDSLFEQDSRSIAKSYNSTPIVNGAMLKAVKLVVGKTRVPHTLGRPWVGWKIVDQDAPGNVYRDATDTDQAQVVIPLIASAPMTVNIWVF